jgi:hypothetical protein
MAFRILALGLALTLAGAQSAAQNPTLATSMREKLVNAQLLLGAVVGGDSYEIGRSARALSRISEAEIATWQSAPPPDYANQAVRFLRAVQGLQEAARTRDLEAALAQYTALVTSCARCHAIVRRTQLISIEGGAP